MSKATKTRDSRDGAVRFCGLPAVTKVTIVVITTIVKRKVWLRSRAGARDSRAARCEPRTQEKSLPTRSEPSAACARNGDPCFLSGFGDGAEVHFAEEALRALGGDHGDGVGDVLSGQDFAGVFWAATGKFSGDAAGTDSAYANVVGAQIFRHAAAEALHGPF